MRTDAEGMADELRSYGISVESLGVDDAVHLTYMTAFPGRTVHRREVGRACNAFVDLAAADEWDPRRVEAVVERAPGDVLGTWHLEAAWITALAADEMSETAFSDRVLATLEDDA